MNRRHPLPAEVYRLVEQTPATVLLEGGKPDNARLNEAPWTQLFTAPSRVCVAYTAAEIPELFAVIERAVAMGQRAAGRDRLVALFRTFFLLSRSHASRSLSLGTW
jgi:hypothetical protein